MKIIASIFFLLLLSNPIFAQSNTSNKVAINNVLKQYQLAFKLDSLIIIEPNLNSTFKVSAVPAGASSKALLLGLLHSNKISISSFKIKKMILKNDTIRAKVKMIINESSPVTENIIFIKHNTIWKIDWLEGRIMDLMQTKSDDNKTTIVNTTISQKEYKQIISDSIPIEQVNRVVKGDTINKIDSIGKPKGKWSKVYNNGSIMCEGEYVNGKKEGYWHKNFENGKTMYECYYHEGKYNGISKNYYENGNLKDEGNYINGIPEGEIKKYFFNGQLQSIEHYSNGELIGPCEYYDETGKKLKKKRK